MDLDILQGCDKSTLGKPELQDLKLIHSLPESDMEMNAGEDNRRSAMQNSSLDCDLSDSDSDVFRSPERKTSMLFFCYLD